MCYFVANLNLMKNLFLLTISIFLSINLLSQEIVTDRPDQTESALSVPKGAFQLESGFLVEQNSFQRNILMPTNLFRYGISNNFELRLVHEFVHFRDEVTGLSTTGFNDLQIGFKVNFLKGPTQIGFLSHLAMPTGSDPYFSSPDYGSINKLAIGHDISDRFGISYNLGLDYFGEAVFTYSFALGFGLTEKIGFYVEPYGSIADGDHEPLFDMGFTFLFNPVTQLDFSWGSAFDTDSNYLSLGISWLVPGKNE